MLIREGLTKYTFNDKFDEPYAWESGDHDIETF